MYGSEMFWIICLSGIVPLLTGINGESVGISSYSKVTKTGTSGQIADTDGVDAPRVHRAREGVMNPNLWFPETFNQTVQTNENESIGRAADVESRQFPFQLANSPVFNGKQAIISPPVRKQNIRTLNHRYDTQTAPFQYPNSQSFSSPSVVHSQQRFNGKYDRPTGKYVDAIASDRYTGSAAYSLDFKKNSKNNGNVGKPAGGSSPPDPASSQSQPSGYVPPKDLYSFPPNVQSTYIPSIQSNPFKSSFSSYLPPPAGPAESPQYSTYPGPYNGSPLSPTKIMGPTMVPMIGLPQPKDMMPTPPTMTKSNKPHPPSAPSDSMMPSSLPMPPSGSPPDAIPSSHEIPDHDHPPSGPSGPSSHETFDHPPSGPSSHEMFDHDHHQPDLDLTLPPSASGHHQIYLDSPPDHHDHSYPSAFDHDHPFPEHDHPFSDHDFDYPGSHGIDAYPEVILDHHDYIDHHFHHPPPPPPPTTTPPPPPPPPPPPVEETGRVKKYSYFYLGRKLWYIPLYFTVWFTFYIAWLIIQSIGRHKIDLPNHTVSRRSLSIQIPHRETTRKVDKATVFVMNQIEEFVDKYL